MKLIRIFIFGILYPLVAVYSYSEELVIEPVPDWVVFSDLVERVQEDDGDETGITKGWPHSETITSYLGDEPVVVGKIVRKVINPNGNFGANNFSIVYINAYQTYAVHKLKIHRNGEIIDAIGRTIPSFTNSQAGNSGADHQYSSVVKLNIPGLRIEDVIELVYSIRGQNIDFNDQIFGSFAASILDFISQPMSKRTIIVPKDKHLFFNIPQDEQTHKLIEENDRNLYVWDFNEDEDENSQDEFLLPFTRSGTLYSETDQWGDIYNWAVQYYPEDIEINQEVRDFTQTLTQNDRKDIDKLKSIYGFLRKNVDYLNIPLGRSGYIPFPAQDVLRNRYGDCKDQSMLLAQMLRSIGIKAWVAMVDAGQVNTEEVALPSPHSFNHAIVYAEIGREQFWLDPTRPLYREAPVWTTPPGFKEAFILKAGEDSLREIDKENEEYRLEIISEYLFPDGIGAPGKIIETETLSGLLATEERINKSSQSDNQFENLENRDVGLGFDDEVIVSNVKFTEKTEKNALTIKIETEVQNGGKPNWANNYFRLVLDDFQIRGVLDFVDKNAAKDEPIWQPYPLFVKETRVLQIGGEYELAEGDYSFESAYHRFETKRSKQEDKFIVRYSYETLSDIIPVEAIDEYLEQLKSIKESEEFTVHQYNNNVEVGLTERVSNFSSKIYPGSPRTISFNDELNKIGVRVKKGELSPLEGYEEVLSKEHIPLDTHLKTNLIYASDLHARGQLEKALVAHNFIKNHAFETSAWVDFQRARTLSALEQYEQAQKAFSSAVKKINPNAGEDKRIISSAHIKNLGRIYLKEGITIEDIEFVTSELELLGDMDIAFTMRGLELLIAMYWKLDDYENIAKHLRTTIGYSTTPEEILWSNLYRVYQLAGNKEKVKQTRIDLKAAGFDLRDLVSEGGNHHAIHRVAQFYPDKAELIGIEGYVLLEVDVNDDGKVTECTVIERYPSTVFDNAACDAAMHNRYYPFNRAGGAENPGKITTRYEFKLSS